MWLFLFFWFFLLNPVAFFVDLENVAQLLLPSEWHDASFNLSDKWHVQYVELPTEGSKDVVFKRVSKAMMTKWNVKFKLSVINYLCLQSLLPLQIIVISHHHQNQCDHVIPHCTAGVYWMRLCSKELSRHFLFTPTSASSRTMFSLQMKCVAAVKRWARWKSFSQWVSFFFLQHVPAIIIVI